MAVIAGRRIAAALLLLPLGIAHAHAPIDGIGGFYNGILHPLFVPAHVLCLLALGLFLGRQKATTRVLWLYLGAAVLGLFAAAFFPAAHPGMLETVLLADAAILGLLLAIHPRVPLPVLACAGIATGFLLGWDSLMENLTRGERTVGLFGTGLTLYLFPLYPMTWAEGLQKPWQRIGARIVGSWIAASSLLVLSLSLLPAKP